MPKARSHESSDARHVRLLQKDPKLLDAKPPLTGDGQFVQMTHTADFARQLRADHRAAPRAPAVDQLGEQIVEYLKTLKGWPARSYMVVAVTERVPFAADGGRDIVRPDTVF